jgi:hypothetical protein
MQAAREALFKFASWFIPLPDPNAVADFIDLEAALPDELPMRSIRVDAGLQQRGVIIAGGAWALGRLHERLMAWPRLRMLVGRLRELTPPAGGCVVLVSPATKCVSCNSPKLEVDPRPSFPTVFCLRGKRNGELYSKVCFDCGARHGLSFAAGGHIPDNHVRPLPSCLSAPYVQVYSNVYSKEDVMERFKTQATHSHTAFETFCSEYFTFTGDVMTRPAFSATYIVFALLLMLSELKYEGPLDFDVRYHAHYYVRGESPLNRTLREFFVVLSKLFVVAYAKSHIDVCRNIATCKCWIFDGHMKCRRATCDNNKSREVVLPELGSMILGCSHTPFPGSRFCYDCKEAASGRFKCTPCDGGKDADTDAGSARGSDVPPSTADVTVSHTTPTVASAEDCDGEASVPQADDAPAQADEWLVECLQDSRGVLRRNESSTCRTKRIKECMRMHHKEYLVKFVGYDERSWVCQCDIGQAALAAGLKAEASEESEPDIRAAERVQETADWKFKHTAAPSGPPSARTRHAGERAASMLDGDSGDFRTNGQEEDAEDPCNNLKENQYAGKIRRTTAGVLALISACGLFLAVDELIGSESLKQVHSFLYAIMCMHGVEPPAVLAYDDACHLLRWWQLREHQSPFVAWLLQRVKLVVDRFHFKNHIGKFCKLWVDPAKCVELGGNTQTEAAEQSFAWLARSKHTLRYMSEGRFQFMVLHLMNERNKWLMARGVRAS